MPWPYSSDLRLVGETERELFFARPRTGAIPAFVFGGALLVASIPLLRSAEYEIYGWVCLAVGLLSGLIALRRLLWRETLIINFESRTCTLTCGLRFSPRTERGSLDALRIQGIEVTPGVEITSQGRKPGGVAQVSFVFNDHEPVTVFESKNGQESRARLTQLAKKLRVPATIYEWNDDLSELNARRIE
jgi:hypothetical protein